MLVAPEPPVLQDRDPCMDLPGRRQLEEIGDIGRDEDPLLSERTLQDFVIGHAKEAALAHVHDIVAVHP